MFSPGSLTGVIRATVLCLLAISGLLVIWGAEPAGASDGEGSRVVGDARADTTDGNAAGDIKRVRILMPKPSAVRIVTALHGAREDTSVFVNIEVGRRMYQVRGDSLYRVRTFDIEGGPAQRVGPAIRVEREQTTLIQIRPQDLGDPRAFSWMVETLRGTSPVDSAPSRGFARFRLPYVPTQVRAPRVFPKGGVVRIRVLGFPAGKRVWFQLQPTRYRGGNAFGVALRRVVQMPESGSRAVRLRVPGHYYSCSPGGDCGRVGWMQDMKVDLNVCTRGRGVPTCARAVARIR